MVKSFLFVLALAGMAFGADVPNPILVDNFEADTPKLGRGWETYSDENKLGTKVSPFMVVKEENPPGLKGHGKFAGHLGENKDPWPWAVLDCSWQDDGARDLTGYTTLKFWAKGDGKKHRVRLGRAAIEDHCFPEAPFIAPKGWILVTIPLSNFKQPEWGKQIPQSLKDVTMIGFAALDGGDNEDFELHFSGVEFVGELPAKMK